MHFTRLRLAGFKSFVEPTELAIEPGLTGVVGPNGCGKSNLIEGLRWVMGETSAKKMRGGAMDDVIFNGTTARPARNIAEVSLLLDNAGRDAPAAYNDGDELEIVRRIERESGSGYRINGGDVRARDVQLLFADLATGAHATALVSQGQIGALIAAKPVDRRRILEEAAGITGLHSRRHEAELRLRAAENNLERLDDVMAAMEDQLRGLKRQARQATRYRNLSGHIRRAEAMLLYLRWRQAETAAGGARQRLGQATGQVADLTAAAAAASTAQAGAAEALPPLRQAEAESAARLHHLAVTRDGLEAEEKRAREAKAALEARLAQIAGDGEREQALLADATDNAGRLESEAQALVAAREGETEVRAGAEAKVTESGGRLTEREQALDEANRQAAEEAGRRRSLAAELAEIAGRSERQQARRDELRQEQEALGAEFGPDGPESPGDAAVAEARVAAAAAREAADGAEAARLQAQESEAARREDLHLAETANGRNEAEAAALGRLLAVADDELWPPLIDAITVEPGFETALGAALGDELGYSADAGAPVHWLELPPYDATSALPAGSKPLSDYVAAPPALQRRLSQIGVVDGAGGAELRQHLAPGQRLVGRDGALWRWDGFTAAADAPTAAATRLAQRNRQDELNEALVAERQSLAGVREAHAEAAEELAEQNRQAAGTRDRAREADDYLRGQQESHAAAIEERAARQARLTAVAEALAALDHDLDEGAGRRAEADQALSALPPPEAAAAAIEELRSALVTARESHAEARAGRDALVAESRNRDARSAAIARESETWAGRRGAAESQIAALGERRNAAQEELAALSERPDEIARERAQLFERIAAAEAERDAAADALVQAESELARCDKAAQAAQQSLAAAREDRVRIEAQVSQAEQQQSDVAERMRETLSCTPAEAPEIAELKDPDDLPEIEPTESRLERLKRERDNMGPVNLRADAEAAEINERLETLNTERADLEAAIARLRQGIGSLNREGRERLLAAFKQVDEHFQALFERLFGGGQAHLALTESEDPLEAGLEIMASPPGKRMQVMSLLSGGEQALTALALLFSVFLTNPSPICVLDEVDAPLDDANVERFLGLVEEIARASEVRFLIVTHNPLTMARMDRLFGVTMTERGVSRLVSVDLGHAEHLRATA
ncbi:MAG: chromosome segregation protein SMC [Alphaproteobacteria bacterium]|nr:chromosome segregation protein SMC [Alphaproteobacteria bacterium]HJP22509.1 chromosome segregation protein SMC [Alphaproteobacteria bacterium]